MINGHSIYLIAATDNKGGIGKHGLLPWHLKKEMAYFSRVTKKVEIHGKQNMVLMGRSTWESIPKKYRPLPHRFNVILTRNVDYLVTGASVASSIEEAFSLADDSIETIFIIGGGRVYKETIQYPQLDGIYLTEIQYDFDCDTFFPQLPPDLSQKEILYSDSEGKYHFNYCLYKRA